MRSMVDEQVALDLRAAADAARGGREVLDALADARRRRRAGAVAPQAAAVVLLWCEGRVVGGICYRENEKRN